MSARISEERQTIGRTLIAEAPLSKYAGAPDAPRLPSDWDKGFDAGWQVGGGGEEQPFLKNGKWYLYVWNRKTGKHAYYCYADDIYQDSVNESVSDASGIQVGDTVLYGADPRKKGFKLQPENKLKVVKIDKNAGVTYISAKAATGKVFRYAADEYTKLDEVVFGLESKRLDEMATPAAVERKFTEICGRYGFVLTKSERGKPNPFKPTALSDEFVYLKNDVNTGRRHTVLVILYPDGHKHWVFKYTQKNGIIAPSTGDTIPQLDRALAREFSGLTEAKNDELDRIGDWITELERDLKTAKAAKDWKEVARIQDHIHDAEDDADRLINGIREDAPAQPKSSLEKRRDGEGQQDVKGTAGSAGIRKTPAKATYSWQDRQKQNARKGAGLTEEIRPTSEVQRVYDETGDVKETELLCGIASLRINGNGQVISFIAEATEKQCAICKCPATDTKHGFAVCDYHTKHGEDGTTCPDCKVNSDTGRVEEMAVEPYTAMRLPLHAHSIACDVNREDDEDWSTPVVCTCGAQARWDKETARLAKLRKPVREAKDDDACELCGKGVGTIYAAGRDNSIFVCKKCATLPASKGGLGMRQSELK
jgi:hypothetical protein